MSFNKRLVIEKTRDTERLEKLIVFLVSKGIVSKSKVAHVIDMSLADLIYRFDDEIEEAMENDCND